jgi:sugar lactone lactonase YvrE
MAFDAVGNLWMTVYNNYPTGPYWLVEMNQSRAVVAPSPYRSSYIGGSNLAIDGHGNIWVPGYGSSNTLTAFSSAGAPLTPITLPYGPSSTFTLTSGSAVVSGNNNFIYNEPVQLSTTGSLSGTGLTTGTTYYVSATGLTATQFELSATLAGGVITAAGTGSGTHSIHGTAAHADRAVIDRQGNIWLALTEYCEVVKYGPAGKLLATASVDAGGTVGKQSSNSLAIDGANNLWVAGRRNAAVWEVSSAGTVSGPWTVPGAGALTSSVDQQGNVWVSSAAGNFVTKVQGVGGGVKTPLVANLSQTP